MTECVRFLEMANIVEILREAGPGGLHVKEITKKVAELRAKNNSEPVDLDPSKFSAYNPLLSNPSNAADRAWTPEFSRPCASSPRDVSLAS